MQYKFQSEQHRNLEKVVYFMYQIIKHDFQAGTQHLPPNLKDL